VAAELFGVRPAVVWGGVLWVVAVGAAAAALPAFWAYDARRDNWQVSDTRTTNPGEGDALLS
jgi:hypothetical protein